MKILMLCDNYPPEMNANARIFSEVAEKWTQLEQKVTVITSHPNFPNGKIFQGYKNKWLSKSIVNDVEVIRVKTYMYKNHGFVRRTIDFFSFGCSSFFAGIFKRNVDAIVGVTPQFFSALSACCLSLIKRKPFVLILCDLWPDSIVSNKLMGKGAIYNFLKKMEIWMYRRSDLIAILSESFKAYLCSFGIDEGRIFTSIAGASDQFYPREKSERILERYDIREKFVIGYIGTFGVSHNHEDILRAAESLQKQKNHAFHFMMIGDGAMRENILRQRKQLKLKHVTLDGPFASDEIPDYWSVVDVAIVPLANTETNKTVLPSKMLEAMAMGIPIILYAPEGEASIFLAQTEAGWHIEVGNLSGLVQLISALGSEYDRIADKKSSAIAFSKNFTREKQAHDLIIQVESLGKRKVQYE